MLHYIYFLGKTRYSFLKIFLFIFLCFSVLSLTQAQDLLYEAAWNGSEFTKIAGSQNFALNFNGDPVNDGYIEIASTGVSNGGVLDGKEIAVNGLGLPEEVSFVISSNTPVTLTATNVRYVTKKGGIGTRDGLTWATAYNETEVNTALANGDEVRFSNEDFTVSSQITVPNGKTLLGGCDTVTNTVVGQTILRSNGKSRIFEVKGIAGQRVYLKNLTLTGATSPQEGGVIYATGTAGHVTIDSCLIIDNIQTSTVLTRNSAILFLDATYDVEIYNSQFINNNGRWGVVQFAGDGYVTPCKIYNTVFKNNISTEVNDSASILHSRAKLELYNCLFIDNKKTTRGAVIRSNKGSVTATNCTFVNNQSTVCSRDGQTWTIKNSVAFGNADNVIVGSWTNSAWVGATGVTNINLTGKSTGDLFVSSTDFTPKKGSVLVNAGDNTPVSEIKTDLAGNDRICAGIVDIGAYELQPKVVISTSFTPVEFPFTSSAQVPTFTYSKTIPALAPIYTLIGSGVVSNPIDAGTYVVSYSNPSYLPVFTAPLDSSFTINLINTITFNHPASYVYTVAVTPAIVDLAVISSTTTPSSKNPTEWTYEYSKDNFVTTLTTAPDVSLLNIGTWKMRAIPANQALYGIENNELLIPINEIIFLIAEDALPVLSMTSSASSLREGESVTLDFDLSEVSTTDVKVRVVYNPNDFEGEGTKDVTITTSSTSASLTLKSRVSGETRTAKIGVAFLEGLVENKVPVNTDISLETDWVEDSIRYVSVDGSGHKNGKTPNSAANSTQLLSLIATGGVDTIRMAGGSYEFTSSIILGAKTISGSWDSTFTTRPQSIDSKAWEFINSTIFNRGTDSRMLGVSNGGLLDGVVLDGKERTVNDRGAVVELWNGGTVRNCIVKNGSTSSGEGGGGIATNPAAPPAVLPLIENTLVTGCKSTNSGGGIALVTPTTVRNCTIENNTSSTTGGGINIAAANSIINNCIISNNTSSTTTTSGGINIATGGGINIAAANSIINNCIISNNTSTGIGGGINIATNGAGTKVENTVIASNKTDGDASGGARVFAATDFINCVFANNEALLATSYSGALGSSAKVNVKNCTFVNNKCGSGGHGAGGSGISIFTWVGSNTIVTNSLFYGGVSTAIEKGEVRKFAGDLALDYCAFEPGSKCSNVTPTNSITSLTANDFIKPSGTKGVDANWANYDWSLKSNSVCINRGTNGTWKAGDLDIVGKSRIWEFAKGGTVDMGAYESSEKGYVKAVVKNSKPLIVVGDPLPVFTDVLTVSFMPASPSFTNFTFTGTPTNDPVTNDDKGTYSISLEPSSADAENWIFDVTPASLDVNGPIVDIEEETPVFITLGQSNADGWGTPWNYDYDEEGLYNDERFPDKMGPTIKSFYNGVKPVELKMFFKSLTGQTLANDVSVGADQAWLDLHYQSDIANGKTSMISRQNLGTGTDKAKYARALEAPLGYYWASKESQGKPLYFIKAAAGGSDISSWINGGNWTYFKDNVYKPAIDKLIASGKKPRLVGIWWMQGESDVATAKANIYAANLEKFATQVRSELGFPEAKMYVGSISGTNYINSGNSGEVVYNAQKAFCSNPENNAVLIDNQQDNRRFHGAMTTEGVLPTPPPNIDDYYANTANYAGIIERIIDGRQVDPGSNSASGHYTAGSQAEMAKKISDLIGATSTWNGFSTVGTWANTTQVVSTPITVQDVTFTPSIPATHNGVTIEYKASDGTYSASKPTVAGVYDVRATINYNTWNDEIFSKLYVISSKENVYVRAQSMGIGNGDNWENALGDLQLAIQSASLNTPKGTVHIENGIYELPQIDLKGVNLIGSYKIVDETVTRALITNHEGPWDFEAKTTFKTPVATFTKIEEQTIDGIECIASSQSEMAFSSGTIRNCIFEKQGIGIDGVGTRDLIGSKIHNVKGVIGAIGNFGGTYKNGTGTLNIHQCYITDVIGTNGIVFFANTEITVNLSCTLITKTEMSAAYNNMGGAVGVFGGTTTVNVNYCTIVDNSALAENSAAVFRHSGTLNVKNSILWGNKTDYQYVGGGTITNCAISQPIGGTINPGDSDENGNIQLSTDNHDTFGPRFKKIGWQSLAPEIDPVAIPTETIDSQYLLGPRSILINRGLKIQPPVSTP